MPMIRALPAALFLPWLVVASVGCSASSPDDGSSGDGADDGGASGGGGGGGDASTTSPSGTPTSTGASTSSGCVEDPPACEGDDRADDTCSDAEDDCYAVTACTTLRCRRTLSCSSVEGSSGTDGEEVSVRDGQACTVEGEVCDGIPDSDGVAHCTASARCEDGFWVQIGGCEPDPEA